MGNSDFDDFLTLTRRRLVSGDRDRWEETAMDLLYLGLSVLFFGLSWALVKTGIRRLLQTLAELDEGPREAEEQHAQSQIQEIHRGLLPSVPVATHDPTASQRQEVVKIGVPHVKRVPKSERSRVLSSFHR